jgi:hypothetical protein
MDLRLYWAVLTRRKRLVAAGLALAVLLALLTVVRIDFARGSVGYRSTEKWVSYTRVFVTQRGFPYGEVRTRGSSPSALAANALFYSNVATSDTVLRLAFGPLGPRGTVQAAPVLTASIGNSVLPIISIAGIGTSAGDAKRIAAAEAKGLIEYVQLQQRSARIPEDNRIVMKVVNQARFASRLQGRSVTLPVVVFLTVLLAVVGVAFALENMNRTEPAAAGTEVGSALASARPTDA